MQGGGGVTVSVTHQVLIGRGGGSTLKFGGSGKGAGQVNQEDDGGHGIEEALENRERGGDMRGAQKQYASSPLRRSW